MGDVLIKSYHIDQNKAERRLMIRYKIILVAFTIYFYATMIALAFYQQFFPLLIFVAVKEGVYICQIILQIVIMRKLNKLHRYEYETSKKSL